MITKKERFVSFIKQEKMRSLYAFSAYLYFCTLPFKNHVIHSIFSIFFIILTLMCFQIYLYEYLENKIDKFIENKEKLVKNIVQEIKKVAKELLMFLPIFIISILIINTIMIGKPSNETSLELSISNIVYITIIGPVIEEFIFRFLPYRFIKNKIVYIIVSTIIFALMHVIGDSNLFYYIWFYMIRSVYYGYRYYKTKDLLVTISMHVFNNLVYVLSKIFF